MAIPSRQARLADIEKYRNQVLSHPLARGISPDEVCDHLASVPAKRFPQVLYDARGEEPYVQPRGGFPLSKPNIS